MPLLTAARRALRTKGLGHVAREGLRLVFYWHLWLHGVGPWVHRLPGLPRTFRFMGEEYRYFRHPYNLAWNNERTIEVPLGLRMLEEHRGKRVLEVGNVLSHYAPARHDILDKYEVAPGVINEDAADFQPKQPYEVILSISTLEHVGWDEPQRDPAKLPRAIAHLRDHVLAPGGLLWVTMPLGWNPHADKLCFAAEPFTDRRYLLRVSQLNRWREATAEEVRGAVYDAPYTNANAVFVGALRRGP